MSVLGDFRFGDLPGQGKKAKTRKDAQMAAIVEARTIREDERKKKQNEIELGRQALIRTTPRGVLNPQTSGRRQLTG